MSVASEQVPKLHTINYYEDALDWHDILKKLKADDIDEAINICDLSNVIEKYQLWQQLLPRVKPFYALKCNDDPFIVKVLAKLGANFDCASKMEIEQILKADVAPERIIFANPCRPLSHINYAKTHNVTKGTIDNEFELYKMYKNFPQADLVLRFRSDGAEAQCPLGDKFGCDTTNDAAPLMLLAKSLNLNVIGVSFHVGSGCKESLAYDRAIKSAGNIFKFGALLDYDMNLVDIGGGFPGNDDEMFGKIADRINNALNKHFPNEKVQIIAEPGRFFVASAYTLICKIHAKREVRNHDGKVDARMYYINDGVYGSFNCILYDHQHVEMKHLLNDTEVRTFKSIIWGPTCDALDKLTDNSLLPNLNCGDFIAFPNMGAYTVPIASPFNGFLLPQTYYFLKQKLQLL